MEFESIVDVQLRTMLEGIEQDLVQRRQAMLEEARLEARNRLRETRRQARQRMSATIAGAREQWHDSLRRARAALAGRLRRKQHEQDREQLQHGERELRGALQARWEDAAARQEWAAVLLQDALGRLPRKRWLVEYPATLAAPEAQALFASPAPDVELATEPSADLDVGFRLHCGEACIDMSITGLLAQSEEIAGELLAEIRRQQGQSEGDG